MRRPSIELSYIGRCRAWRRGVRRVAAFGMTIRGRILIAFLVMSMITAALGYYATLGIKDAGILVDKTYRSIADVDQLRARRRDGFRRHAGGVRAAVDRHRSRQARQARSAKSRRSPRRSPMISAIAVQRSQSKRAKQAAANVQREVAGLDRACASVCSIRPSSTPTGRRSTTTRARSTSRSICWSITPPATASSTGNRRARRWRATSISTSSARCLRCVLSGMVAWALARRIVAAGRRGVQRRRAHRRRQARCRHPERWHRRTGRFARVDGLMRDNIKAMMEREVAQRRTAQARLADALESSQEGVVVVDADDCIALANAQAADFLGVSPDAVEAGHAACRICSPAFEDSVSAGRVLSLAQGRPAGDRRGAAGGRPLAAHQPQRDPRPGLHRRVQRHQPSRKSRRRSLRQTNLAARRGARQHVAGPVPVRRAEQARGGQSPLLRNLRAAARSDRAGRRHSAKSSN